MSELPVSSDRCHTCVAHLQTGRVFITGLHLSDVRGSRCPRCRVPSARHTSGLGLPLIPCGCGRAGCLERYISGTGISARPAGLATNMDWRCHWVLGMHALAAASPASAAE